MPDKEIDFEEVLITPLGKMISTIGRSIADSQLSMNQASLEAQGNLSERNPQLHALGYMVPWYNLSEVELEMKIAVHVEDERTRRGRGRKKGGGKMFFSPFNAKYQNNYRFGSNGSSSLKMKVMPVPPPQPLEPGADEN